MKSDIADVATEVAAVAPFVGAWIEIPSTVRLSVRGVVAPFVGAWIEISCGTIRKLRDTVAPFVGAWIEMAI